MLSTDPARCAAHLDMTRLLAILAEHSERPRYTFMVLNLIAQAARPDGSAGPLVVHDGAPVLLRDWLCDALTPMAARNPRRRALADRVRRDLAQTGDLPDDPAARTAAIDCEVRARTRSTGKTAISRAVTELVAAGLLSRHYQGYCIDHENRGAQRHAVYTLGKAVRQVLGSNRQVPAAPAAVRQHELAL